MALLRLGVSRQELAPRTTSPPAASSMTHSRGEGCGHLGEVEDFGREPVNPAPFQQHSCTPASCAEPTSQAELPESPTGLGFVTASGNTCCLLWTKPAPGPAPLPARPGWGNSHSAKGGLEPGESSALPCRQHRSAWDRVYPCQQ